MVDGGKNENFCLSLGKRNYLVLSKLNGGV
jgi:hypothetical protein